MSPGKEGVKKFAGSDLWSPQLSHTILSLLCPLQPSCCPALKGKIHSYFHWNLRSLFLLISYRGCPPSSGDSSTMAGAPAQLFCSYPFSIHFGQTRGAPPLSSQNILVIAPSFPKFLRPPSSLYIPHHLYWSPSAPHSFH